MARSYCFTYMQTWFIELVSNRIVMVYVGVPVHTITTVSNLIVIDWESPVLPAYKRVCFQPNFHVSLPTRLIFRLMLAVQHVLHALPTDIGGAPSKFLDGKNLVTSQKQNVHQHTELQCHHSYNGEKKNHAVPFGET